MVQAVALILGAGPNVGTNVAKAFAAQGYNVAITSRSKKDDEDDAKPHLHIQADLAEPSSIEDIFATVIRELGHPSVVVYNGTASFHSWACHGIEAEMIDVAGCFLSYFLQLDSCRYLAGANCGLSAG